MPRQSKLVEWTHLGNELLEKGQEFFRAGNYESALNAFTEVLKLDQENLR